MANLAYQVSSFAYQGAGLYDYQGSEDTDHSITTQRPPNVDFVVSPPYYLTQAIQVYRKMFTIRHPRKAEHPELKEMMELYNLSKGLAT